MFNRRAMAVAVVPLDVAPMVVEKTGEFPSGKKVVFGSEAERVVSFDYDPKNYTYFRCRAITADAANGNGDLFPEKELKASYKSFIGIGLYKDHDSDSVDKSIGKVLWAEWVPSGKYVECYCAVDKQLAPDLARRVESGIATSVSMGCSVQEAECGVPGCGNIAHNPQGLCQHMTPGIGVKGRKGDDGEITYEINRGLQFTELSLVTVPADPTARIFQIFAQLKKKGMNKEASALLAEARELIKTAGPAQDEWDELVKNNPEMATEEKYQAAAAEWAAENPEAVPAEDAVAVDEQPAVEQPAVEPVAEQPAAEQPAAEQPADKKVSPDFQNLIDAALKEKDSTPKNVDHEMGLNWKKLMEQPLNTFIEAAQIEIDNAPENDYRSGKNWKALMDKHAFDAVGTPIAELVKLPGEVSTDTMSDAQLGKQLEEDQARRSLEGGGKTMTGPGSPGWTANTQTMEGINNKLDQVAPPTNSSLSGANNKKGVEKLLNLTEKKMALAIKYSGGKDLASSYFTAKQGESVYRVAAADVLPLIVQEAILTNAPGIATPEQIVEDLATKYASLSEFKRWAKRRKKKNKKAQDKADCGSDMEAEAAISNGEGIEIKAMKDKKEEAKKAKEKEAKEAEAKKAKEDKKKEKEAKKAKASEAVELARKALAEAEGLLEASSESEEEVSEEAPVEEVAPEAEAKPDLLAAFESLKLFIESKLDKEEVTAAKVDSIKAPADGEHGDKSVSTPLNNEVTETKSGFKHSDGVTPTKGLMPKAEKGESMDREAIDQNWSMNQKELEPAPKQGDAPYSANAKEIASEQLKNETTGQGGSNVPQYYGKLPKKGPGAAPHAWDAKSSKETKMLREALAKETAEKDRLLEKERLQAVADKIYEIVAGLREKNIVTAEKEDAVIDTLTKSFASLEALEGMSVIAGHFNKQASQVLPTNEGQEAPELGVGKVVPQVFDTIESSEDAIQKMSAMWNL